MVILSKKRPAIAMIELIFAIVIMGIVMMSAPMLISTSSQSTNVALQQEGINEAASRVNMIMGYSWDENDTNSSFVPPILHTTAGATDLNMVLATGKRIGSPIFGARGFIRSDGNELNASTLGSDTGDVDDVDDFIGNIALADIETATTDYVEKSTISIATTVTYVEDNVSGGYAQNIITYAPFPASSGGTSSIKTITVTLTSTDTANADVLAKNIVLRAFSCNIGGYAFETRGF